MEKFLGNKSNTAYQQPEKLQCSPADHGAWNRNLEERSSPLRLESNWTSSHVSPLRPENFCDLQSFLICISEIKPEIRLLMGCAEITNLKLIIATKSLSTAPGETDEPIWKCQAEHQSLLAGGQRLRKRHSVSFGNFTIVPLHIDTEA